MRSRCSEDVQSHRNSSCITESTINILLQVNFFHLILVKNNIWHIIRWWKYFLFDKICSKADIIFSAKLRPIDGATACFTEKHRDLSPDTHQPRDSHRSRVKWLLDRVPKKDFHRHLMNTGDPIFTWFGFLNLFVGLRKIEKKTLMGILVYHIKSKESKANWHKQWKQWQSCQQ